MHFRKLNGLENGRTFVAFLFPLILLTSFGFPVALQSTAGTKPQQSYSECDASLIPQIIAAQAGLDSNRAIILAEHDSHFIAAVNGQEYSLSGVAPSYSFNTATCSDLSLNAVSVNFDLPNSLTLRCGHSNIHLGVQVFEDAAMSHVTGVQMDDRVMCPPSSSDPNNNYWDGYQVYTTYGGVQNNQVYSTVDFGDPTVTSNSYCSTYSPYECGVAVWTGLSNATVGNNAFIAQTGTLNEADCSGGCGTFSSYGWYQFLGASGTSGLLHYCPGADTPSAGDSMQAFAENGYYWGGSSNDYRTWLFDNTGTGWVCPSTSTPNTTTGPDANGLKMYAETIVERTQYSTSYLVLATFDSGSNLALQGNQECYYDSNLQNPLQCTGFYNTIQSEITMKNTCSGNTITNINTSSLDSSSDFTETFNSAQCT